MDTELIIARVVPEVVKIPNHSKITNDIKCQNFLIEENNLYCWDGDKFSIYKKNFLPAEIFSKAIFDGRTNTKKKRNKKKRKSLDRAFYH